MKKEINVVAAVIIRGDKVLCTQRNDTKYLPYKWEFPGGKIEAQETEKGALIREIREELSCTIEVNDKIIEVSHEYDFAIVNLTAFYCNIISEEIILNEHKKMTWARFDELKSLDWAEADLPIVNLLLKINS